MSGYDDPYAWERTERYLASIRGDQILPKTPCECPTCKRLKGEDDDEDDS